MLLVYHFYLKRKIWIHKFPLLDSHRSFCNLALASETGCSCCRPQPSVIESNAVSAKTLCLLCVKVVAFPMFSCQGLWVRGDRVVIWRGEGSEWKRSEGQAGDLDAALLRCPFGAPRPRARSGHHRRALLIRRRQVIAFGRRSHDFSALRSSGRATPLATRQLRLKLFSGGDRRGAPGAVPFLQGEVRDWAQPIRARPGADATDASLRLVLPEEAGTFFFFFLFEIN